MRSELIGNDLIFNQAGRFTGSLLRLTGKVAIVTPWGVCYHTVPLTERLRRHEQCHWQQYQRHGRICFLVLYAVESLRHGYRGNRFEIEAREAESKTTATPDTERAEHTQRRM